MRYENTIEIVIDETDKTASAGRKYQICCMDDSCAADMHSGVKKNVNAGK